MQELALHELVILASTIEFVECRALKALPDGLPAVEAAFELFFEHKVVFEDGKARFMTLEEIEAENLDDEVQ